MSTAVQEPLLTTTELLAKCPISYRQLDYWIRSGLIPGVGRAYLDRPQTSGNARRFTREQVELVQLIAQMANEGLSFRRIRDAVAKGKRLVVVELDLAS